MALRPCKECGNSVSTTAGSCPKCGAAAPKETRTATWVISGVLLLVFGMMIWPREADELADQPNSPEQAAAKQRADAEKDQADRETNIVLNGARWLKDSMKKPESFELTKAFMIDGKVICYEYKARNSFNDRTSGFHVITDSVNSGSAEAWNKHCAGKFGADYTSVRALL